MRGNQNGDDSHWGHPRSIPAYAGEPLSVAHAAKCLPVYPRVCGGTGAGRPERATLTGLSPRMRGNLSQSRNSYAALGSIPAYAGEPDVSSSDIGGRTVYPRVCGGTAVPYPAPRLSWGLSPRMRGNQQSISAVWTHHRSIPAYAGEPDTAVIAERRQQVYPRVCGGTRSMRSISPGETGLSPRMRGNLVNYGGADSIARSIPAYAGEPRPLCASG